MLACHINGQQTGAYNLKSIAFCVKGLLWVSTHGAHAHCHLLALHLQRRMSSASNLSPAADQQPPELSFKDK